MINLIPNQEKKRMAIDFYLRFSTVLLVMLGLATIMTSILVFPSYFMSIIKRNTVTIKLESQEGDTAVLNQANLMPAVKELERKITLIEKSEASNDKFSTKVINEIVLKKTSNIKITSISYRKDIKGAGVVDVRGRAKSREGLLGFRRALEDNPAFSKVDLPISNFVKESDIKFSLVLTSS